MRSLYFAWTLAFCMLAVMLGAQAQDLPRLPSAQAESISTAGPSHQALLIGINEYQDPSVPDLSGSLTDIEAMSSVLIRRFGFSAGSVAILTDRYATRDGILRNFERLIDAAGPNTAVVVYFSGHGSAVKDMDGDEKDGWDDTLVPYDSGRGRVENRDITDDELNIFLSRLSRKTKKITLIIDAATGGATATRGFGQVKAAPADYRERRADDRMSYRGRGLEIDLRDVIIVSAGASGSLVVEGSFGDPEDPVTGGVFSYYLTRRLWESGADSRWQDVFEQISADMLTRGSPRPIFEGDIQELVFDSPSDTRRGYFMVNPRKRDVLVDGGMLHGLSTGSMLELFPPDTVDFTGSPVGTVRLSSVDVTTSIGEIVDGTVDGRARAVLSSVRYEKSKIRVRLDLSKASELAEELRERLEASDLIELVDGQYDLLVRESQGELHVEGPSATQWRSVINPDSHDAAVAAILKHVDRRAQWLSLLELANPSAVFRVGIDLQFEGKSIRGGRGPAWVRDGENYLIRVTNTHFEPVYPVILALSAYDQAQVLHPRQGAPGPLAPEESFEMELTAFLEPELVVAEDVIKVIVSTEPIGRVYLGLDAVRAVTPQDSFAQLLDYRTRGSLGETSVDPRTWATDSLQVRVARGWILWVDDNPENNQFVRKRFNDQGWPSVTARSTREALQLLETQRFDVVISDFSRPRDDLAGYRLLDELNGRDGSPPLIYYVGNYTTEQAEEAKKRGALGETNSAQEILKLMEQVRQGHQP